MLHCNSAGEGWTADSPDLAGWQVTGASYDESRARAEEAVRAQLDGQVVRTLGSGECFGEIALLRDQPRSATVCASGHAQLRVSRLRRGD